MKFTNLFFVLAFLILPSPIIRSILPLSESTFSILILLILFIIFCNKKSLLFFEIRMSFFTILIIGSLGSLLSSTLSQFSLTIFLTFSLFLSINSLKLIDTDQLVWISLRACYLMIMLSWIGFIYTFFFPDPLFCISNPDGRANCLYLSTFSNTDNVEFWRMIRPSGIFDEPGALSFFITQIIIINSLLNRDLESKNKNNLLLFFFGLITFSVAHLLLFICYMIYQNRKSMYKILIFLTLFSLTFLLLANTLNDESILFQNFFSRFTFTSDGSISGDNRSGQIVNFFNHLDMDLSLLGANEKFKNFPHLITEIDQSANPFSIWFNYGFITWIPYIAVLVLLLITSISKNTNDNSKISSILLFLLLLQRPYIYSPFWCLSICMILMLIYNPILIKRRPM